MFFNLAQYLNFYGRDRASFSLIQTPSGIIPLRPLRPDHASHEGLGDAGGLATSCTRDNTPLWGVGFVEMEFRE